jgi:hypothetical protein
LLVVGLACPSEPDDPPIDPLPRALVDVEAWTPAEGELPAAFVPLDGARISCDPIDGYGPEPFGGDLVFEVNTGFCNWGTFEQPLLDDVAAGELVQPRLWHFELTSPFPAEGYAALAIGHDVVWEYRVAIPSESALAADGWIAEANIPAGTPIRFHVHNHGINSWNLVEITAEPQ